MRLSPFLWTILWQAALLPFAVTLFLGWAGRPGRAAWGAVALTVGFSSAYALLYTQHAFPPVQALDWLALSLPVVLLLFVLRDRASAAGPRAWLWPLVAVSASLLLLLWPILKAAEERFLFEAVLAGLIWWGLWCYLERKSGDGTVAMLALTVVACANAAISAATGSVLTGQLSGALAAAAAGWLLWHLNAPGMARAVVAVAMLVLGSLVVIGRFYADTAILPILISLAGFAAVPLFPWIAARVRHRMVALCVAAAVMLIPTGIAVLLALRQYAATPSEY